MSRRGYLVRELEFEHKLKRLLENKVSFKPPIRMQASPEHPSRLSNALRAYARVSDPVSSEPVALDERVLRRKQKKKKGGGLANEKSWHEVTSEVISSCSKQDKPKVD